MSQSDRAEEKTFLERAYALQETTQAKDLYDEWAGSYDKDLDDQKYASPKRTVEAIEANLEDVSTSYTILDAGCGTGLVGDCLKSSPLNRKMVLDGIDLSPGMLEAARKKQIYRKLDAVDLSKDIPLPSESYDIISCVGTLTKGHVGPSVLREFVRLVGRGGLIAATVHEEIWQTEGFEAEVERLKADKAIELIQASKFGIIEGQDAGAIMLVIRRL